MKHHGHTTSEITSICMDIPLSPTRGHVSDEITRLRVARHRFVSRPKVNPPSPCRRNLSRQGRGSPRTCKFLLQAVNLVSVPMHVCKTSTLDSRPPSPLAGEGGERETQGLQIPSSGSVTRIYCDACLQISLSDFRSPSPP